MARGKENVMVGWKTAFHGTTTPRSLDPARHSAMLDDTFQSTDSACLVMVVVWGGDGADECDICCCVGMAGMQV